MANVTTQEMYVHIVAVHAIAPLITEEEVEQAILKAIKEKHGAERMQDAYDNDELQIGVGG